MDYGLCMDGTTARVFAQAVRKMQQLGWPVSDCDIALIMVRFSINGTRFKSAFNLLPDQWCFEKNTKYCATLSIDADAIREIGDDRVEKYKYINEAINDLSNFIDSYLIYYQE